MDRDPKYMAWLKENCMCLVCVKLFNTWRQYVSEWKYRIIDPCHTRNNGMRSKGDDGSCVPMCRCHHREYDSGRAAFELKYEVDMTKESAAHYALFSIARENG